MLRSAGLRRAELVALDLADLDLAGRRVRILGNGRFETEWLPIGGPTAEAIDRWLDARGRAPGPLFVRLDRGAPAGTLARLAGNGLDNVLARLGRRAGLSGRLSPHRVRHHAITRLAALTGGDMPRIQKFSRHAKIETVARYIDNARTDARDLADLLDAG